MLVKKKQLLTATLLIALVAAVSVNWYYTNNPVKITEDTSTSENININLGDTLLVGGKIQNENNDEETTLQSTQVLSGSVNDSTYFADAKMKRDKAYDEAVEEIEEMLQNENLTNEEINKISESVNSFKDILKLQTDTENIISAKTGGECLVIINNGTAQVILQKGTLNDTVVLQITDIFEKNAQISAENLTIIETK